MAKKLTVMIVDDDERRANSWLDQLNSMKLDGFNFESRSQDGIRKIFDSLSNRLKKARAHDNWHSEPCELDAVDVLLIDFDLLEVTEQTGEQIAYLVRVLSKAKLIYVINQWGTNRFDLTLVNGLDSHSDLDIGSEQILNLGLWHPPQATTGYRPWHWPNLTEEIANYDARVADVKNNMGRNLLEFFGFDPALEDIEQSPPRKALSFFNGLPQELTFASLSSKTNHTFIRLKDAEWLINDPDQLAHIAAFAIHKWLERWVLPHQDILIDAPHLAARKPWLLKEPPNIKCWNATVTSDAESAFQDNLQQYRFTKPHWLSRPAFLGNKINAEVTMAFPKDGWDRNKVPDLVFLEDMSTFAERDASQEFVCELGSSDDIRFIANPKKMGEFQGPNDPRKVDYVPAVRLAL